MKKNIIVTISLVLISILVILFIVSSKLPETKKAQNEATESRIAAEKVEVVYFHSSKRCATCLKAGTFVENTMKGFEAEIAEGEVVYMDVNVEDPAKKEIVEKYQARGSSLFIGTTAKGQETVEEEAEAWRYLGDEGAFKEYLSNKVNGLLGF